MKRRFPVLRGVWGDHEQVVSVRLIVILHTKLLAAQPCPNSEHEHSRYTEVSGMSFSSSSGIWVPKWESWVLLSNYHIESLQGSCQVTHSWLSEFNFFESLVTGWSPLWIKRATGTKMAPFGWKRIASNFPVPLTHIRLKLNTLICSICLYF